MDVFNLSIHLASFFLLRVSVFFSFFVVIFARKSHFGKPTPIFLQTTSVLEPSVRLSFDCFVLLLISNLLKKSKLVRNLRNRADLPRPAFLHFISLSRWLIKFINIVTNSLLVGLVISWEFVLTANVWCGSGTFKGTE
jgi:hypothetical protein